jgi:S-methylmethionine-dependent homocysteine/selenocysteine methylase
VRSSWTHRTVSSFSSSTMPGKGLMERLAEGVVVGDGGFVTIMEKRGYSRAGLWTPEASVEHPEAGAWRDC